MSLALALDVRPLTPTIGAEVCDLDLAAEHDEDAIDAVRAALLRHRVLFFRGQRLDAESQVSFAAMFGRLTTAHPTVPGVDRHPRVLELDASLGGRANEWHTDVTFVQRPPLGAVLRAVELPPVGGDTVWASTVAAYDSLPDELRAIADSSWATHTNGFDYAEFNGQDRSPGGRAYAAAFTSVPFETRHPIVRVHPETGERSLLLGAFARRVTGLDEGPARTLIRRLQHHITKPEHTVRWRWQPGDVAMWDNRATQHYAVNDYGNAERRMQRVTIAGDVPVSIDGRPSEVVRGDVTDYVS